MTKMCRVYLACLIVLLTSNLTLGQQDDDVHVSSEFVGYYSWNWGAGSQGPKDASSNGIAFTGLVDLEKALQGYTPGATWCCPELKGNAMVTVGGGNAAGMFTVENINDIAKKMSDVLQYNYTGIVFDVEEVQGTSGDVSVAFENAFAAAKHVGLTTIVTTSHSAPYQTDSAEDAVDLVKSWVKSENLDILSPQLYSSGYEKTPEFATTASCSPACGWDIYRDFNGIVAPSIVDETQYEDVQNWFSSNVGVKVGGYIQWAQT